MPPKTLRRRIAGFLRRLLDLEPRVMREETALRPQSRLQGPGRSTPARLAPPATPAETKLQTVRLTRIKAVLGTHWSEHSERICRLAESVITKRLLPGDVYQADGDDSFLVLFVQLSPDDARFKAEVLSREIERLLMGSALPGLSTCSVASLSQSSDDRSTGAARFLTVRSGA